jgi:uncharacterized protein (DUF1778 family)
MKPKKSESTVKETVSWRIKPDVMKLLEEAQRITGSDRTEIIERCILNAIDEVTEMEVSRKLEEAKRAAEALKKHKQQQ